MFIEMKVQGVAVDSFSKVPIVILKDNKNEHTLPIWIGSLEASAIAATLDDVVLSRPMTHDLLADILGKSGVEVERIDIVDIKGNVYYANIHLANRGEEIIIDARPSDAIAVALRKKAPIMVDMRVIEKSGNIDLSSLEPDKESSKEDLSDILEDLTNEDFGKYKM